MKQQLKIAICGDICPTDDNQVFFENNDAEGLFNDTLALINNADIAIANLEFPFCDNCKPIKKTGPILKGKSSYVNLFIKAGFDVLSLANNHIKDCGTKGVLNTLEVCKQNSIWTVGAGKNEKEAKQPLIIEKNGWKIGFIAFAEHEFNAAYANEAGANLFDVYNDFDLIRDTKKKVDFLIILNHGGIEYYKYPSPLLKKKCKKMIDTGADYITNQHSHVIGTEEVYKGKKILYGQGNTVFGYKDNKEWDQGLVVNIEIDINGDVTIENIPITANITGGVELLNSEDKNLLLQNMKERSNDIMKLNFVKDSWNIYCEEKKSHMLPHLFGLGRISNKLNRFFDNKLINLMFSKKKYMITHNLIRCESHNEVIQTILKNESK